jgi:hypothetical protein
MPASSSSLLSYQRTDDPEIRMHMVRKYRYKIFYSVAGDTVEIILCVTPRAVPGRVSDLPLPVSGSS